MLFYLDILSKSCFECIPTDTKKILSTFYKKLISFYLAVASPELGGKCRACEAIGASWCTQVRTVKSCNLSPDSSLYLVFFIIVFPTAFYDCSRMTGRYLIPFCKIRFSCLLTLTPFVSFADTFSDKRGQLTIDILSFCNNYHLMPLKNAMHLCRHS